MFFSRSPRFPVQFTAVYDDGERYLTAPVTNLSGSGLFIETLAPADEGASVHIVPLLPPSRGLPELQGVVVRVQDGQAELGRAQPVGMGIRFVALGEGDAEQLRDYCENLKLEGADAKHEQLQGKDKDKPATVKTPDPVVGYRGLSLQKKEAAKKEAAKKEAAKKAAAQKEASQEEAVKKDAAQHADGESSGDAPGADATRVDVDAETRVSETAAVKAEAKPGSKADVAPAPEEAASDAEPIASDEGDAVAAGGDDAVAAAPSHAEARTTAAVSDEDAMPMLADDDAELVETAEVSGHAKAKAEEPIPLEKTKRQPVLLDKRKSVESSAEDTDATEPDAARPAVAARSSDVSEPPAVEDTPAGETEKIDRTLSESQTAWDIPAEDQPYADLLRGDDDLGAVVAPRGQGAVIALGVLNLIAVGGAIAYGAYRLDSVDQRQGTADARLTTVAQDVGFVSERTKTLQRGLDGQRDALAGLSEVVLKSPSLTQSIDAAPAGAPGRYVVQTAATIANPDEGEGEVVYVSRRVLVGNLGAVPVALGKAQNINGAADKGQVAWTVLEEEQHLSDGTKLKRFASLTKQERSELKKGAKVGDVVGPLVAGGAREDRRQLLLDLPQGGLLGVEMEVGLIVDDKPITLKHVETTGVPAVVPPVER